MRIAGVAVFVLVILFAWTFVKRPLAVPGDAGPTLPSAQPVEGVSLSMIRSAEMTAREGFSVRGGSLTKTFLTSIAAFVVQHPRGTLLIDAGVGRRVDEHFETTPFLMRVLAELSVIEATADALDRRELQASDIEGIVLTHSHWDHVSGLADLRGVPVWITPEELAFARSDERGGELYRQIEQAEPLVLRELVFSDGPYGPFESSCDFFEDGSVVAVPMPGHTPGSVGVFVTEASGKRSFIIGDTSWTREGVQWPAEKPWLARRLADHDAAQVREQLVLLHRLQRANSELAIVPAHDARVHDAIPKM